MGRTSALHLLFLVLLFTVIPTGAVTISNCYLYTVSNTSCTRCNAGYYITSSGAACTAYDCSGMSQCNLCDSNTTCLGCNFGYQLSSDRLSCSQIACSDNNCTLCASTSSNQCYSCGVSYYLTTHQNCSLCSNGIANC